MADIKTRDTVKGAIKAIDKSAVAAERMKDAFIRTKEKAEHSTASAEDSPETYAADQITGSIETFALETAHQYEYHAQKSRQAARESLEKATASLEQRKAARTQESTTEAAGNSQEVVFSAHPSSPENREKEPPPKMTEARLRSNERKHIWLRSQEHSRETSRQFASAHRLRSIKGSTRAVKTAERSARASVKTAEKAAQAAQASAKATAKAAERTALVAKAAVKAAGEAIKIAAELAAKIAKAVAEAIDSLAEAIAAGGWIAVAVILVVVLLGSVLAFFSWGSDNGGNSQVSDEVEAYSAVISYYALQNGIPEYVDLIKAVMMQESGGVGGDPMQCSESGYNERYPRVPGGITDPEYSILVGIQALTDVLRIAGVESPFDIPRLSLALQGYNYGPGYITWALDNYGGYSEKNALEFSQLMSLRYGWDGYGDPAYVAHVLRYYSIEDVDAHLNTRPGMQ